MTAAGEGIEGDRPKAPDQSPRATTEWAARGWRSSGGAARGGRSITCGGGGGGETLIAAAGVGRRGTIERDDERARGAGRAACFVLH